jgi:hypothetical protein
MAELLNELAESQRERLTRIYLARRTLDGLRPQGHDALAKLVIESADDDV